MVEEKLFIINLRREFIKKPIYRRSKKAITAVKEYISKHLKVKEVKIGGHLNQEILKRGRRHPPPKVKVNAYVEEDIGYVELEGFKFEKPKPKEEKEGKTIVEKLLKKEEKTTEEETKEEEKEQLKELKKEGKRQTVVNVPPKQQIKAGEKVKFGVKQQRAIPESKKK